VVLAALGVLATLAPRARAEDEGDRATLARLEQRSRAFYDLLERGERGRAAAAWPGLANDLAAFATGLQQRLDRMRDDVVERDGDLDELLRSERWRGPEVMELVATYHLAWVRYQGAQLTTDAATKKDLLRKAAEGFTQFLLVNEVPEIYAESLYGRGLAFLDLGDYAKAIADLTAAVDEPRVAAKARPALEEARRRAAGGRAPAAEDPETLLARLGDALAHTDRDAAREKEAATLARGLAARGGPWPARVGAIVREKLGDPPRSTFGLHLAAQLAVDRGRCDDVAPLAEASGRTADAGRSRWRPDLLFLDAGCRLNAGQARDAAERFAALLAEYPDAPRAADAAYYRFRALDVARADDPRLAPAYEAALRAYLARFPRAEGAGEARFALGELLRARGDCAHATREYGQVGTGRFAARARLGALECRVAALGPKAPAADRRATVDALRAFVRETPARGADEPLVARAALLAALVAAGTAPPDHAAVVELLDGFETRYPGARELHPRALELRLVARVATGALEPAARDLDAWLRSAPPEDVRRRVLTRLGRDLSARVERTAPDARGSALALARRVYGALVDDGADPSARIALANLDLEAGDAAAARRLYEAALAADADSAEALRGAARAAAAVGDREAALGYWRRVLD